MNTGQARYGHKSHYLASLDVFPIKHNKLCSSAFSPIGLMVLFCCSNTLKTEQLPLPSDTSTNPEISKGLAPRCRLGMNLLEVSKPRALWIQKCLRPGSLSTISILRGISMGLLWINPFVGKASGPFFLRVNSFDGAALLCARSIGNAL